MFTDTEEYREALDYLKGALTDPLCELDEGRIVRNAIQTPDGTVIESTYRHDYVEHKDANGHTYMVDGGTAYFRRSMAAGYKDLSVTLADDYEVVRDTFKWGRKVVGGHDRIKLMDIALGHLISLFDYYWRRVADGEGTVDVLRLFLMEGAYRDMVTENYLLYDDPDEEGSTVRLFPKWPKTLK